jgi:hypothetical protein
MCPAKQTKPGHECFILKSEGLQAVMQDPLTPCTISSCNPSPSHIKRIEMHLCKVLCTLLIDLNVWLRLHSCIRGQSNICPA